MQAVVKATKSAIQVIAVRDEALVRALAFHQCGVRSIPSVDAICALSLLLVLVPAPRVFLWVLRYFKFQFVWKQ